MTKGPFERALVRKGRNALKIARLALEADDNDSAVSRSYYAMLAFAQAALLRAGIAEDKMPRTHGGIIEAFWRQAVQSGKIDREVAAQLSRTESLRIKADYTGTEIEPSEAKGVVVNAEIFVQTVERAFALDNPPLASEYQDPKPKNDGSVSEPDTGIAEPAALEDLRRQARENWLRMTQRAE